MKLKSAFFAVLVSLISMFAIACDNGSKNSGGTGGDNGGNGGGNGGGGTDDKVIRGQLNFGYIGYTVNPDNSLNVATPPSPSGRSNTFQIKNDTSEAVNYKYSVTSTTGGEGYFEPAFVPIKPDGIDPKSCIQNKVENGEIKKLENGESCDFLITPKSVPSEDAKINGKKVAKLVVSNGDKVVIEMELKSEYIMSANVDNSNPNNIHFAPSVVGVQSPSYFLFETTMNKSRVEQKRAEGLEFTRAEITYAGADSFKLASDKSECGITAAGTPLPVEENRCVVAFTFTPPDATLKTGTFTETIEYQIIETGLSHKETETYTLNGEGTDKVN